MKALSTGDHGLGKVMSFIKENSQMPDILGAPDLENWKKT